MKIEITEKELELWAESDYRYTPATVKEKIEKLYDTEYQIILTSVSGDCI